MNNKDENHFERVLPIYGKRSTVKKKWSVGGIFVKKAAKQVN